MISIFKAPELSHYDYYDKARFLLAWRISITILLALICFTFFAIIYTPQYLSIIIISLVLLVGIFILLWKTKRYSLPAKLILICGIMMLAKLSFFK